MAYPTNPIYKLIKSPVWNNTDKKYDFVVNGVKKQLGNSEPYQEIQIPFKENNTDYQEYLEWVSKGNTAEEPD
tara:strand:- start:305 stop:523 length:219 start_codon:yes stop_codon:yes gene_type:complete